MQASYASYASHAIQTPTLLQSLFKVVLDTEVNNDLLLVILTGK